MQKASVQQKVQQYKIPKESEYRFEVDWSEKIEIRLLSGTAEIFGTELALENIYTFSPGTKLCIFTWHGAEIEVKGVCKVNYIAQETPMMTYLNTHLALETKRKQAKQTNMEGPRTVVVGPKDCGKTSLIKILISYSLKLGNLPLLVDLDTQQSSIIAPSLIGAVAVNKMDFETATGYSLVTAPPLLYYFGHESPNDHLVVYKKLMTNLAEQVLARAEQDDQIKTSGFFIDTPSWNEDFSMDLLKEILDNFQADIVLVLGNERLFSEIHSQLSDSHPGVQIQRLTKSEGAVDRDLTYKRQLQLKYVHEYFYGSPGNELTPHSTSVALKDIQVRRIIEVQKTPLSALPIGSESRLASNHLVKIEPGPVLLHSVLFVSSVELPYQATEKDEEKLINGSVRGLVYVRDVDEKSKRLHLLSPQPGRLPNRYLLMGTLRWAEIE